MPKNLLTTPRRALSAVVTLLAVGALLTACAAPTGSGDSSATRDDAFPVTLSHVYGDTTITEKPERIVTIGWASQDVVAALGTVPVATGDFTWGSVDKYLPWFKDRVEELGGPLPELLQYVGDEIDFEQVLSLKPDLILAVHSGISENEYERLSEIAPTVAYKDLAWTSDWKELTRTVGEALGQSADADRLVEETDAAIDAQAAAHPEFKGVTFTYGWYLEDGATSLGLYVPQDPRVQVIEQLGFTLSPQEAALGDNATGFYGDVSLEKLDTVESDLHIGWVNTTADTERTLNDPLASRWAPIAAGHYYFMDDQALAWASSQPTVLSIPWSLSKLVPEFAKAIGD